MTSGQFLALALAAGFGALGVALTVAIAGPTKPAPGQTAKRPTNGRAPVCRACRPVRPCQHHARQDAARGRR